MKYGKNIGMVFGGLGFLLNTIEFTQIASLYLFLDMKMPNNLKEFLGILHSTSNFSTSIISIDM